jgi:GNAT superfamily N-acetyltransferase
MKETTSYPQIRRAAPFDVTSIASVLKQAFAKYEPLYTNEGYAATTPDADGVRTRMEEGPVWVALYNGEIVATASAVSKPAGLYVRGMAALPASRGLGVGRLLLVEIERFAATHGYKRLFLSTTPFLTRAIRLYESCGFQRASDGPQDLFGTPLFTMQKMLQGPCLLGNAIRASRYSSCRRKIT